MSYTNKDESEVYSGSAAEIDQLSDSALRNVMNRILKYGRDARLGTPEYKEVARAIDESEGPEDFYRKVFEVSSLCVSDIIRERNGNYAKASIYAHWPLYKGVLESVIKCLGMRGEADKARRVLNGFASGSKFIAPAVGTVEMWEGLVCGTVGLLSGRLEDFLEAVRILIDERIEL